MLQGDETPAHVLSPGSGALKPQLETLTGSNEDLAQPNKTKKPPHK